MKNIKSFKYYDRKYFEDRKFDLDTDTHVVNVLLGLLAKHKVKKILEVASGAGDMMRILKHSGFKVEGIDISETAAKMSGSIVASATDIPFKNESFDCLIGLSMIEHLTENEGCKFLNEAFRVLKPGGIIFLLTPNFASPLRYLKGSSWYGYSDKSHVKFYTPQSIKKLLENHNFYDCSYKSPITTSKNDWPLPKSVKKIIKPFIRGINYLLVSTELAVLRDSVWIFGVKN